MNALTSVVARFEADEQVARRVADRLCEHFAVDEVAVGLTEAEGRWQVAIYFRSTPNLTAVNTAVQKIAGREIAAALRFERIAATDWVPASLAGLAPVVAGRFVAHGAHDRARIAANQIGIEIEAGLAFGTGHHGTTRGCLLALDRIGKSRNPRRPAPRILDLGTGSGVLAIAAARSLRARVLATDIDTDAVYVARANAALNHAAPLMNIVHAGGVAAASVRCRAPFDIVFANILLGPLRRLATPLKQLVAPGGRLVLSGLLAAQANVAIAAYRPLALERRITLDGWSTLVFVRRLA